MIRIVKWSTDWCEGEQMKGSYIVLFNRFSMAKGQWDGFMTSLQGLGLSKNEKFLGLKRTNKFTLYFLKWYFSYDNEGYKNSLQNVTITKDHKLI